MSRNVISIESVRTHLNKDLKLSGLFAKDNIEIFREVYGLEYYSTELDKLSALVTTRIFAGKRNSFVYEDKEIIDIYLLDEVVIRINKKEKSYSFAELSDMDYTEPVVDERIMDFIHDLKQQLKTLTKKSLLEEMLQLIYTEE